MVVKWKVKVYMKENMTRKAFAEYWLNTHAPLVKKMPGVKKYIINLVLSTDGEEPGYQGTAELWFDSIEAMQLAVETPEGQRAVADTQNFMRMFTSKVIEEHVVI